jgi:hypothetical protein
VTSRTYLGTSIKEDFEGEVAPVDITGNWSVLELSGNHFLEYQGASSNGTQMVVCSLEQLFNDRLDVTFDYDWRWGGDSSSGIGNFNYCIGVDILNDDNNGYRLLVRQGGSDSFSIYKVNGGVAESSYLSYAYGSGYSECGWAGLGLSGPRWKAVRFSWNKSTLRAFNGTGQVVFAADYSYSSFTKLRLVAVSTADCGPEIDNITAGPAPKTQAPVFSPDVTEYISGPTEITITAPDEGAEIYYTTDGKTPSAASTRYTDRITVTNGTYLRAVAVKDDASRVTSKRYSYPQASAPIFTPGWKYISKPTDITITATTANGAIYYTTDGSDPMTSSTRTLYSKPVTVTDGTVLKASAIANSYNASNVTSMTYVIPDTYNRPALIPYGKATVDGNLSDWSDASWAALDLNYYAEYTVSDVTSAYYAARWQANKVYVAVKVYDTAHYFTNSYTDWNVRDAIELYLHTDNPNDVTYVDAVTAQQYAVGIKNSNHSAVWTAIGGGGVAVPFSGSNSNGMILAAGSVDGNWLYYEVELTPFTYLGFLETGGLSTSIVTDLKAGNVIGLDVNVIGHDATNYTGVKVENMMAERFHNWQSFGLHKLECMPGDANSDGAVDVGDLGILAANYGGTGKTWAEGDFNNDGVVDVGDLGILAANYGSSGSGFNADYAKVFGTTSVDSLTEDSEDTTSSLCSSLGLSLIAGLAMLGMMIVKLDE